jgi:hypothetical protein
VTDGSPSRSGTQAKTPGSGKATPRTPPGKGSRGPSGSRRAGRRETARPPVVRPTFLQRYRGAIIGVAAVGVLAVVGAFLLFGATQPAYACETESTPAPSATPAPGASSAPLGQAQADMGRRHVEVGASVKYASCPPASGAHYNAPDQGPIKPQFYAKDSTAVPQGWIHNLEHGGLVLLYRCGPSDTCDSAQQQQLQAFVSSFPASPVCNIPAGAISPVVARFDQMATPYAALVWGRILMLQTLDTSAVLKFFAEEGERTNPEPQCASPGSTPGMTIPPSPPPS